jgi:isoleucyl-tRNA synthetase
MYDPKKIEQEITEFWKNNQIYEKNKEKNKNKKPFYFLQGPPYTSGDLHLGQALNNTLKDAVLRYKRMRGFDVWDRPGYDMHGIPISSKVQKKLRLKSKEEIERFGIDKFNKECMEWAIDKAKKMDKDLQRMAVWFDYSDPYYTLNEDWIEATWFLVKKANEKDRLYEGEKTMSWCATCETGLAKHECEYKKVIDKSIFVKFKIRNENRYLIIWTTTPWTIAFNLAIMVNPDINYVEAEVEGENWIIAKDLADKVIRETLNKNYIIKQEFKGSQLKGLKYEHPWEKEIPEFTKLKLNHPKVHTVVFSREYVNLESGTGLVHCAPGCGPEDYEVGYENNLPPYNTIDEKGVFPKNMGFFSNLIAKKDDEKFILRLEKDGALVGTIDIEHDYAHHERCNTPVIFKTTKQWFFKVEDLKEDMLKNNKIVHWVPESMKNAFDSWLDNLRDNSITRQRYWGTPVPIWRCENCKEYIVIESKEELIKLSGEEPENLHRPWVDKIKIRCSCGSEKERIPDVLDVWLDAGVGSWACLYYPKRKDIFEKYFPPEFILEGKDQIRGWFNVLQICSMIALNKPAFSNVFVNSFITDVEGVKMSKSLGNIISPYELIEKYGVDTMRLYLYASEPGADVNFSWEELKNKYKLLIILWNIHEYLLNYSRSLNINPAEIPEELGTEEKYILSKLNKTIRDVTELYEFYNIDKVPQRIEEFILSLSREYIQSTRDKIYENPQLVLSTIFYSLLELLKMFSTICPFITEKIYQNLRLPFSLEEESISLEEWPRYLSKYIDEELEKQFSILNDIVQAGLAAREKAKRGVRWPLSELKIISTSKEVKKTLENLGELLKSKLNVKNISLSETFKFEEVNLMPNKTRIGKDFKKDSPYILEKLNKELLNEIYEKGEIKIDDYLITKEHIFIDEILPENLTFSEFSEGKVILDTKITDELEQEGFARELIRRIQDLRKEKGLKKKDVINLSISSDYNLEKFKDDIRDKVGASIIEFIDKNYETKQEFEIKGKKFKISFSKL